MEFPTHIVAAVGYVQDKNGNFQPKPQNIHKYWKEEHSTPKCHAQRQPYPKKFNVSPKIYRFYVESDESNHHASKRSMGT